eukprot:847183-Pyramimonas_sp.AAC.1
MESTFLPPPPCSNPTTIPPPLPHARPQPDTAYTCAVAGRMQQKVDNTPSPMHSGGKLTKRMRKRSARKASPSPAIRVPSQTSFEEADAEEEEDEAQQQPEEAPPAFAYEGVRR